MPFTLSQQLQQKLDQFVPVAEQKAFIEQVLKNVLEKLEHEQIQKKQLKTIGEWTVYSDGGARGNPGPAGCGAVIFNPKKEKQAEISHFLPYATNNEAEYQALLLAVEKILPFNPNKAIFYLDSELIVKQMRGEYKIKKAELLEFAQKIKKLLQKIPHYDFKHIPREKNRLADRLANQAIDDVMSFS